MKSIFMDMNGGTRRGGEKYKIFRKCFTVYSCERPTSTSKKRVRIASHRTNRTIEEFQVAAVTAKIKLH